MSLLVGYCLTILAIGASSVAGSKVDETLAFNPCGANETFALKCASMKELCENQCYDLYQRPIATDPACSSACQRRTPMCLCNPGLYRLDGRCVPKEECPRDCKDPREIRVSCDQPIDPRCQPSCSDPQRDRNSPLVPGVSIFYCTWGFCEMLSCACRDGFVRDDVSLKCVPKEECSS